MEIDLKISIILMHLDKLSKSKENLTHILNFSKKNTHLSEVYYYLALV